MIKRLLAITLTLCASVSFYSCGTTKSMPQVNGETEITIPGGEYFTDKDFFRGQGIGQSRDMNTAREKARMNANAELATSISSITKRVAEKYVNDAGQKPSDYAEIFESLTREVVQQELNNVRVVSNKLTQTQDGMYKCYMAVEVGRTEVFESFDRNAEKNKKIETLYNREKFRQLYNQEMADFAKNHGQ